MASVGRAAAPRGGVSPRTLGGSAGGSAGLETSSGGGTRAKPSRGIVLGGGTGAAASGPTASSSVLPRWFITDFLSVPPPSTTTEQTS